MFCTNCGAALTDGQKFCGECGHKVISNDSVHTSFQQSPAMQNFQQQADTVIHSGQSMSYYKTDARTKAEYSFRGTPKKTWYMMIIYNIVIAIIVTIGGFGTDIFDEPFFVFCRFLVYLEAIVGSVITVISAQVVEGTYLNIYSDHLEGQSLPKMATNYIFSGKHVYAEMKDVLDVNYQGDFLVISTPYNTYYYYIESAYERGNVLESIEKYIRKRS